MSDPIASTSDVKGKKRGAFIVLEGLDRSGKSTQCSKLVSNLEQEGIPATGIRFPGSLRTPIQAIHTLNCCVVDRTTTTGKMIDAYLKQDAELDDHAIHLLFAVNRWEKAYVQCRSITHVWC